MLKVSKNEKESYWNRLKVFYYFFVFIDFFFPLSSLNSINIHSSIIFIKKYIYSCELIINSLGSFKIYYKFVYIALEKWNKLKIFVIFVRFYLLAFYHYLFLVVVFEITCNICIN